MKPDLMILSRAVKLCQLCERESVNAQNAQRSDLDEEAIAYRNHARQLVKAEIDQPKMGKRGKDFLASTLGLCHYACCAYGETRIAERLIPYIEKQVGE